MHALRTYLNFTTDSERWDRFAFREGDIVISTPPKAGTTLTQMLVALLIFDTPDLPAPLDDLSPWLDMTAKIEADTVAALEAQTHRRFIKTHTPLDGIPDRDDVSYLTIARDPRDVFVSYKHHQDNSDFDWMRARIDEAIGYERVAHLVAPRPDTIEEMFDIFLDNSNPGTFVSLDSLCHQMQLQWARMDRPNVCAQHFLDVKADPVAAMRRIASTLGLDRSDERLAELAEAASIESMRSKAVERAPVTGLFKDPDKFFRTGGSGEWEAFATEEQLDRYWANIGERVDDRLSHWMHHGDDG
ncbi:MAG: sulfotransferase domain-containing protein [Actinomycetota bacterium]